MMLQGHGEGAVRGIAGRISFVDTAVSTDLYKKSYPQRNSRTIYRTVRVTDCERESCARPQQSFTCCFSEAARCIWRARLRAVPQITSPTPQMPRGVISS